MSDQPGGDGWWLASDGRWYPPEQAPAQPSATPQAGSAAPGWWLASDGRWYPPEQTHAGPAPHATELAQRRPFLVGALITSIVGIVLLAVDDFAGWDGSYGYFSEYGWISIDSGPAAGVITVGLMLLLAWPAWVSYQGLRGRLPEARLRAAFVAAAAVTVAVLALGLVFAVSISGEDVEEWWFGGAFYGAVAGGALTTLLLHLARRTV